MIPVNKLILNKSDARAVYNSINKNWISSAGPHVKKFEKKFAQIIDKKYCSSVSNGTAALEIALKTINLEKGDQVIIPNFTIISNAMAVIKQNATPVLVDCDLTTWNMKIDELEKKITKKTKAIIATHIYGYPIEIDIIKKICLKKKLYLIEDAAEMLGHKYKGKYCGYYGDISTFSLYANKHVTTGEGGLILTNNKKFYNKFNDYRNLCFGKKNRFNHEEIAWNYRFTNIQASLGLNQLGRLKSIILKKKKIGKLYYKYLKDNPHIFIQKPKLNKLENIYWVVGILINKKKMLSDNFKKKLKKNKIESRSFFWPMHRQSAIKKLGFKFKGSFKNSDYISKYGLYLPSGLATTPKDIKYVCKCINIITKKFDN